MTKIIKGKKGGGGSVVQPAPYVPIEAANSLTANSYANIIDLLCEGEIGGPANGDSWYKSTYLNEIPVQNSDGSYNFNGVTIDGRTGTSSQDYLDGFNGVEDTVSVNTDVTIAGGAISRTITSSDVDDCKVTVSIPTLLSQSDKGDINNTSVVLNISVTPDSGGGSKQTVVGNSAGTISGKCVSEYRKQFVIKNLSQYGSAPWVITVERVTADSGSAKLINAFKWYSYTSVIQTKLRYYDRSVVGIRIDGSAFGNAVPTRAYKINGRKIKIPDNYDPDTRTYTGDWGGDFTTGVTNNPAWIVYDLLTDTDIGLGSVIEESMVDKWTLYSCGQYCDQTITITNRTKQSNGSYSDSTSSEHRFSFNGVIENRTQALEVITHLCSVMRAYPVWIAGEVSFVQDKPITSTARPVGLSNISDDGFSYQGIPKRDRHSVVKTSWNDPEKLGRLDVVEIVDEESIINYGYNELDFAAFGCTSKTEAIRRGTYALDTDINAREVVNFKGGLEWSDAIPGTLISVQDPNYAATQLEGRVIDSTATTTTSLELDKTITIEAGETYTMLIQQADDVPLERELTNSSGDTNVLTWSSALPAVPFPGAMLVISATNLETRKFVLVSITEDDGSYNISGVEYDPDKYARIESGIVSDETINTSLLPNALLPPTGIVAETYSYTSGDQDLRLYGIQIGWIHSLDPRSQQYELRYKISTGGWTYLGSTVESSYDWKPVGSGIYDISVRSTGVGINSSWLTLSDLTINTELTDLQPPTGLDTLEGSGLFSGKNCTITWTASTGQSYDSTANIIFESAEVGDSNIAYYKVEVRKPDTTLIRTYSVPKNVNTFTYLYTDNVNDNVTPLRSLLFYVYSVDVFGDASPNYASVTASNPAPNMSSTTPTVTEEYNYIRATWTITADNDMDYYKIYADTSNPPTTLIGSVNHPVNYIEIFGLDYGEDYYVQVEPYDLFGAGTKSVIPGSAGILKVPGINVEAEATSTVTITDSDTTANLTKLYDGNRTSDGVSFTVSGTDKYIQYAYGIDNYFDRIGIWAADGNANVYIASSTDATTWTYYKCATAHTPDNDGYLATATNLSDAQTNYWNLSSGFNIALFPQNTFAKYIRIWIIGSYSTSFYEIVPSRILISELAAIQNLSAISADIGNIQAGSVQSTNYDTTAGVLIDLDNEVIKFGGSSNPTFHWDGDKLILSSDGKTYLDGDTIYVKDSSNVTRVKIGKLS